MVFRVDFRFYFLLDSLPCSVFDQMVLVLDILLTIFCVFIFFCLETLLQESTVGTAEFKSGSCSVVRTLKTKAEKKAEALYS